MASANAVLTRERPSGQLNEPVFGSLLEFITSAPVAAVVERERTVASEIALWFPEL